MVHGTYALDYNIRQTFLNVSACNINAESAPVSSHREETITVFSNFPNIAVSCSASSIGARLTEIRLKQRSHQNNRCLPTSRQPKDILRLHQHQVVQKTALQMHQYSLNAL